MQTTNQIADRYNAKKAVFSAMKAGRRISFLDSAEFRVSQMHTTICNIRSDIRKRNLPYDMRDERFEFGTQGKKGKRYWLESKEEEKEG